MSDAHETPDAPRVPEPEDLRDAVFHRPEVPEISEPEELRSKFSNRVAVAISIAIVSAAVVGYSLASAVQAAEHSYLKAQRFAIDADQAMLVAQQRVQADYELFIDGEDYNDRGLQAAREIVFADPADRSILKLEQTRAEQLAGRLYQLSSLSPDAPDGPHRDPQFPNQLFTRAMREPYRLAALQDAANEESSRWQGRAAKYRAILTILALSLYLLGSSLTLAHARRTFYWGGLAALGLAIAWMFGLAVRPPIVPHSAQAADEFATGMVTLRSANDIPTYRSAREHFDRAISLRPTFAWAYEMRATARFRSESPQTWEPYPSLTTPQALHDARTDLLEALRLKRRTGAVLGELGFYEFLLGLKEHLPAQFDEGLDYTRQAINSLPDNLPLRYNLGLLLLVQKRQHEASAAYTDAVRRTVYIDGDEHRPRGNPAFEEQVVAGALTDLDLLATLRPDLRRDVDGTKEFIVGAVSRGSLVAMPGNTQLMGTQADLFPGGIQVSQIKATDFDPEHQVVSVQWYYQGPERSGWGVLPDVSGTITLNEYKGTYWNKQPYLSVTYPPRCLPAGDFRAELYVDGRLRSVATASAKFEPLEPTLARDLNIALCRPSDWKRSQRALPGVSDGYVSAKEDRGVYIFRVHPPASVGQQPERTAAKTLEATLTRFGSWFPSRPTFVENAENQDFMGMRGSVRRWYRFKAGEALAGGGMDDDGNVVIVIIFGPDNYFNSDEWGHIFDSMVFR
jgi:tetratricopeptide (TPR) repeat protein